MSKIKENSKSINIKIESFSEEVQKEIIKCLEESGYSGCIEELTTVEKIKRGLSRLFR